MNTFTVLRVQKFEHPLPIMDPVAHANYYDRLQKNWSQEVRESYRALGEILVQQYRLMIQAGMKIQWVEGEPYPNSAAMRRDVGENHNLRVRKTWGKDYNDLEDPLHPMNQAVNIDNHDDGHRMLMNDLFRAVHDVFGHYASRSSFGPDGEALAWLTHRSTMPEEALIALWCETRGQNAWTNHFFDHNDRAMVDRPFAAQKYGFVNSTLK